MTAEIPNQNEETATTRTLQNDTETGINAALRQAEKALKEGFLKAADMTNIAKTIDFKVNEAKKKAGGDETVKLELDQLATEAKKTLEKNIDHYQKIEAFVNKKTEWEARLVSNDEALNELRRTQDLKHLSTLQNVSDALWEEIHELEGMEAPDMDTKKKH